MNAHKMLGVVLALALIACSRQPSSAPEASASDAATPAPTATVTETSTPAPTATPYQTVPTAIQGRWGLVPADCTSTRGDAKGLLTIDATTLKFYESRGALGAIEERSDTRLRATFSFSGEGMTWRRDEVLDVHEGGKTLIRREYGDDAAPGPFKYTRC